MKANVFVGKFINQNIHVPKCVRVCAPWKFIDSLLMPSQLTTIVPFGRLLALIQHQSQRALKTFLCHFPNCQNPEIDDQIHIATLQFH